MPWNWGIELPIVKLSFMEIYSFRNQGFIYNVDYLCSVGKSLFAFKVIVEKG